MCLDDQRSVLLGYGQEKGDEEKKIVPIYVLVIRSEYKLTKGAACHCRRYLSFSSELT